jgi:hypothetical protein
LTRPVVAFTLVIMDRDDEGLHEIANVSNEHAVADVVFVHGLDGGSHSTWQNKKTGFFWPSFLGNDFPQCRVWTLGYASTITEWFGSHGMAIEDRAENLLNKLLNENVPTGRIGSKPIIFVTHSMGGLMVKQIIVRSLSQMQAEVHRLVGHIRGIVFCGTPHRGAGVAKLAKALSNSFRTPEYVKQLSAGNSFLDTLHDSFVTWQSQTNVPIHSFVEKDKLFRMKWLLNLHFGQAVPQESGNPNIAGSTVVPVAADHIQLVKPNSRKHDVYSGTKRFLDGVLKAIPKIEPVEPLPNPHPDPAPIPLPGTDASKRLLDFIGENVEVILSHYKYRKDRFPIIHSVNTTITITAEGDGIIEERQVFEGVPGRPQNFLGLTFESNQPLSYEDREVSITVHNSDDYQIAQLPSGLLMKKLSLLLMFLPAVESGKPAIDFSHRQVAKGAFSPLLDPAKRTDFYQTSVKSHEVVPKVLLRFRIADAIGPIQLKRRGSSYGNEIAAPNQISDPGYRNYYWEAVNVPDEGQIGVHLART